MNKLIFPHIKFDKIKNLDNLDIFKTFEYLCADFLQIYYDLDVSPIPSEVSNYPWIEWVPFEFDWKFYGYQSKFWKDAFNKDSGFHKSLQIIEKEIDKWSYKLDFLILFSSKSLSTKHKNIHKYIEEFEKNTNIKIIHKFFGTDFLKEIIQNKYLMLLHKYFPTKEVSEFILREFSVNKDTDLETSKILAEWVLNWFMGSYTESDVNIARWLQQKYSFKKLSYSTRPFILDRYIEIENAIANAVFEWLSLRTYSDIDHFLNICTSRLDSELDLVNKYEVELKNIIWNKQWLFINYWTEWKSCLYYETSNKIHFKDKRHE